MSEATMAAGLEYDGTHRPAHRRPMPRGAHPRTTRHSHPWLTPILWAVALSCFVAAVGLLPTARDLHPTHPASAVSVTVSPADTLWSIAAAHRVPGASTAETVEIITSANHLSGGRLQPGTVLSVPDSGIPGTALAQVTDPEAIR
jgi:hypothetical protein